MPSATGKRALVEEAVDLLDRAGYRTDYMDASFRGLASMRERTGTVRNWLWQYSNLPGLIRKLEAEVKE